MKTPYQILDVAVNANDGEIKKAYLKKVKKNSPEINPQQFQAIHDAYVLIKDHKSRVSYDLFNYPDITFDEMVSHALEVERVTMLKPESFKNILTASYDDSTVQNVLTYLNKND